MLPQDDFEKWREELWPELLRRFNPNASSEELGSDVIEMPEVAYDAIPVTVRAYRSVQTRIV